MPSKIYPAKPETQWCDQDVVGESFYTEALEKLSKSIPLGSRNARYFDATLVLEKDNPYSHSGHAISVRWRNHVIGYIPDSETSDYYPELARLAASGYDAGALARLWTSEEDDYYDPDDIVYSLQVGIHSPGNIVPLNDPPAEGWALIPERTTIQVTKENEHFDVLQEYIPPGGRGLLLATLHPTVCGVRKKWTGIEVRLDNQRVGELTKTSSMKILPIVEHYEEMGLTTVCYARLRGSAVAAELTLRITTATEISDNDLDHPTISPLPKLVPYQSDPDDYKVPMPTPPTVDISIHPPASLPNPAANPNRGKLLPWWIVYPCILFGSLALDLFIGTMLGVLVITLFGEQSTASDVYIILFMFSWLLVPGAAIAITYNHRKRKR